MLKIIHILSLKNVSNSNVKIIWTSTIGIQDCRVFQLIETNKEVAFQRNWLKIISENKHHDLWGVITLVLGSQLRQWLVRVWAKSEAWESHFILPRVWEMWGNEPSHSQMSSHFGSWRFNGLLNFQRVIALYWRIFYIIRKFLEPKCLKWSCMTHLGT